MKKMIPLCLWLLVHAAQGQHKQIPLVKSGEVIKEGIEFHDDKKYKEAIEKYLLVSRSDTGYAYAQTELALTYYTSGDYAKAIETAKNGLTLHSEYQMNFYEALGDAYDGADSLDQAIKVYEEGLRQFPYHFKFHYEMGVAYVAHHNDTAAFRCFKKSIAMYPFHSGSHYQLGMLAARNNKFVQSLLSFELFLLTENTSDRALNVLRIIEKIGQGDFKVAMDSVVDISHGMDHFEDIEEIIRSKAALNDKYKTNVKLGFTNMVKTLQVMNEKLVYNASDKGYWMQFYVPFFTAFWKNGYFEPFMYNSCASINDADVQKQIKSNAARIDKMIDFCRSYFAENITPEKLTIHGKEYTQQRRSYKNGHLKSIGLFNDKLNLEQGPWVYFYESGGVKSEGSFNDKGHYDGDWKIYYPQQGELKKTVHYTDGKLNGPYQSYYRNGQPAEKGTYKNDMQDGNLEIYYPTGVLNIKMSYKDGKQDGPLKVYHENGLLKEEVTYKMGLFDGVYKEYNSKNGKLSFESSFIAGKQNGMTKNYYKDGSIESEGKIVNGEHDGEWKYYFDSGKLKKSGTFKGGKETGVWKEFWENGKPDSESNFADGQLNGVYKQYDDDGLLISEIQYSRGSMKKFKYVDKSGKTVSQGEERGGTLDFLAYYPDGVTKSVEGKLVNGKQSGNWIKYHSTGQKKSDLIYDNDKLNGPQKYFFKNGKLNQEMVYKDGKTDGYFTSYYQNGNIESEGWYVADEVTGEWVGNYANGKVYSRNYYLEGNKQGFTTYYDEASRKQFEYEWDENQLPASYTGFDTSGKVLFHQVFEKGACDYKSIHLNSKPYEHAAFKNGKKDGEYTSLYANGQKHRIEHYSNGLENGQSLEYYDNGKPSVVSFYKDGERDSLTTSYFENGKIRSQFNYLDGNTEGPAMWNFENGNLFEQGQYKDDERNGFFIYYASDGTTVRFRTNYKDGGLVSYSYLDKDGKYVPEIQLKNQSGTLSSFYPNGNKSATIVLVNGQYEGDHIYYFMNGKVESECMFHNGKEEGLEKNYYESGKVESELNYYYGMLDGHVKYYNEKGVLKKDVSYMLDSKEGWSITYDEVTGKQKKKVRYINNEPYE